ncbi:MAG: flagellar biosynthesis protein FlhB [Desulfobacterales bacterium]|nr:EscU/YscU/HrcU family type III secretion system export apparatus switch protein [Deltaproteobacteria bacterium]MBT8360588.1 EscU/YscU/HrcU family type III secretion system export apparatus switch protein [Deltaproteobacteria bacterium]NNK96248.1 flagellar biosynthesis protein FlhB [Desulfobacterales bacterium]
MESQKKKIEKAAAILYDTERSDVPRIVASGKGVIAQKIIETAREAGIHIQEDPDLVELLAAIPVGEEIPVELYQTIAEVLAFVYEINNQFKDKVNQT